MKKIFLPIFLFSVLLLSVAAINVSSIVKETYKIDSDTNLSGSYTLTNLQFEERGLDKEGAQKNALFYSYLDGRTLVIDAKQTAEIVRHDRTSIGTFEVKGNEMKIHYFKQGFASFNGSNPQPADSYSVYQFSKNSNGFTIYSEDPEVKESYTFIKLN